MITLSGLSAHAPLSRRESCRIRGANVAEEAHRARALCLHKVMKFQQTSSWEIAMSTIRVWESGPTEIAHKCD